MSKLLRNQRHTETTPLAGKHGRVARHACRGRFDGVVFRLNFIPDLPNRWQGCQLGVLIRLGGIVGDLDSDNRWLSVRYQVPDIVL